MTALSRTDHARMYVYDRAEEIIGARLSDLLPRSNPANFAHLRDYVENGFRALNSESHEYDRQGNIRIFRGVGTDLVRRHRVHRDLLLALADQRLDRNVFVVEIIFGEIVETVRAGTGFQ